MYRAGRILLADKRGDDMEVGNCTKPVAIFSSTMAAFSAQITHNSRQTVMYLLTILDILSVLTRNLMFLMTIHVNLYKSSCICIHCMLSYFMSICANPLQCCHSMLCKSPTTQLIVQQFILSTKKTQPYFLIVRGIHWLRHTFVGAHTVSHSSPYIIKYFIDVYYFFYVIILLIIISLYMSAG